MTAFSADPDVSGNFAAGQPGFKRPFQESTTRSLSQVVWLAASLDGPQLRVPTSVRNRRGPKVLYGRLAIFADRKPPVL